ncbi:MAG: hypothetical protein PWQ88_1082 [Candidatus Methanomethylophilaceae archaeon]|nr:hypothetical protein [Candidatus Methanomethylophilaceae archaeon]MDI3542180.1 hypothetical protein [Candidatus Methanomethylophilaceae archaeon]HIJ00067.1 hypothetical protein [Candidatus Methanomethylophilaceae archaeon]
MTDVCDRSLEEVHELIGRYVYDKYHGKDRVIVKVKGLLVSGDTGPYPLYNDVDDRIALRYCEPDILMIRDGFVKTVIEIDSAYMTSEEYIGRAILPILAKKMIRGDEEVPIAEDVHVMQIVCYHGQSGDEERKMELRLRYLSEDISMLFRNTERGCRYSLILPVNRHDDTIDQVLSRYLDGKIW